MHPHEALIHRFYEAFAARDGAAMTACYHPEATFSDPVFTGLVGAEVGGMWRMLCARGRDLVVTHRDVAADDQEGRAHWDATYTFSTGRKVNNAIDARFRFRDGLIVEHVDDFDLGAWMRAALGPLGVLLGWAPPLRARVRAQARAGLDKWLASGR